MDRLGELLFKVRNPAPEMPEYDRHGQRIPRGKSPLLSPLGGLRALIIEKVAWAPSGLTASQIEERLQRRLDKIKELMPAILEARLLVEDSGVYRAPADLLERLERELERSGCNEAEARDRRRYEKDREARRLHARPHEAQQDGLISELEKQPQPVQPAGDSDETPDRKTSDTVITDANDPDQLRQLAALARERIAEHRRKSAPRWPPAPTLEQAAHLLRRLRREDPECFAALRSDLRTLAWELSGRGWTQTIYCGRTLRAALELLEPERVAG